MKGRISPRLQAAISARRALAPPTSIPGGLTTVPALRTVKMSPATGRISREEARAAVAAVVSARAPDAQEREQGASARVWILTRQDWDGTDVMGAYAMRADALMHPDLPKRLAWEHDGERVWAYDGDRYKYEVEPTVIGAHLRMPD